MIRDNESDDTQRNMRIRVVEDSDILPFLIREPKNPNLIRRFIGSNTGLMCKFCNENNHKVLGRFSEDGQLVITGDHLSTCKPFNLEENFSSVECQTDNAEKVSNETEDFEVIGNILKVNNREYVDSDGDGKMYYCKFCLKTKKIVVEAKVKRTVVEDEHCPACEEHRTSEDKENTESHPKVKNIPSSSRAAKPVPSSSRRAKKKISLKEIKTVTYSGDLKHISAVVEADVDRIHIPKESYTFENNGNKKYILLRNSPTSNECWEFMEHTQHDGASNYRCLACTSYYLKYHHDEKEFYCTPRIHQCPTTPIELLKEKYQDLRAGAKINYYWWATKFQKYNIPAIPRRTFGK